MFFILFLSEIPFLSEIIGIDFDWNHHYLTEPKLYPGEGDGAER